MSLSRVELTLDKVLSHGLCAYNSIISNQYYKIFRDDAPQADYKLIIDASNLFNVSQVELAKFALLNNLNSPEINNSSDYAIYLSFNKYSNFELAQFYIFGFYKEEVIKYFTQLKDIKINLSGADLIALGYEQGKIIGNILNSLLEYRINSRIILTKEQEIDFVLNNFKK